MKLTLSALAVSALIPAAAVAQPMPAPPSGPTVRHAPPVAHGGAVFRHRPGTFRHFRIHRGGFVPPFLFGPQFHVRNWSFHGFPAPFAGGRWIRFHDDALLIDRDGRVHDGRYGWDWRRDGDRWGRGPDGVPVYVGDGNYEPEEWDYEWAERWDRGDHGEEDYADRGPGYGGPDCDRPCGPPRPRGCHDRCGPAYGYGWGWTWMPVMITETITTTTTEAGVETRTYYKSHKSRPTPRRRAKVRHAPPPPPPGERG